MNVLALLAGDIITGSLNAIAARPLMWGGFLGSVAALSMCVHELLERRGLPATAWGAASASLFGLMVAVT